MLTSVRRTFWLLLMLTVYQEPGVPPLQAGVRSSYEEKTVVPVSIIETSRPITTKTPATTSIPPRTPSRALPAGLFSRVSFHGSAK